MLECIIISTKTMLRRDVMGMLNQLLDEHEEGLVSKQQEVDILVKDLSSTMERVHELEMELKSIHAVLNEVCFQTRVELSLSGCAEGALKRAIRGNVEKGEQRDYLSWSG